MGFRTDLALLQRGGTQIEDHRDHLVVRSPHNPTFWWGNFVLLGDVPQPSAAGAWVDRFRGHFPSADHVAIGIDTTAPSPAAVAAFVDLGLDTEVSVVMTAAEVGRPTHWNQDAEYRPLESDDDWAQSVALRIRCDDRYQDEQGYRDFTSAKVRTYRQLVRDGHGGWFGAFVAGRLVCQMGLFTAGAGLARFQSVETDPDYRRLGLAGSLVYEVSRYGLVTLGARTLVMVADPDYFAIDLYRAVGFRASEVQVQIEKRSPE